MENKVRIHFWGVRGSLPSPGPDTVRYGGNTTCVSIHGAYEDGGTWTVMLDAGTGARLLGKELVDNQDDIYFFLTHTHWDHIQGFPFFAPLYQDDRQIFLSSVENRQGLFTQLLEQMDGTHFPLTHNQITSRLSSLTVDEVTRRARAGYMVDRIRVNHPGETFGFRLFLQQASLVFIPDNELNPRDGEHARFEDFVHFCSEADILIHDAQYLAPEYAEKKGWGHSNLADVLELAVEARVKKLVLFHHDPDRTDRDLDAIHVMAKKWLSEKKSAVEVLVAYEGMEIVLDTIKEDS